MNTTAPPLDTPTVLTMSRHLQAPRERVFDAFVDAGLLARWLGTRGVRTVEAESDPRVGGAWHALLHYGSGARLGVGGRYRELSRPSRLAFTWRWDDGGPMPGVDTLVEVDLLEADGGTRLELRHSGFPVAAARDGHAAGWNQTLNRLVETIDPRGSAATLTLFGLPPSSYTRTARLALAEKGVAYAFEACPPHGPKILSLNPFGRVPALSDGSFTLYETSAVCRYVDESFAGPPLLPNTPSERARCEQWISAFNSSYYGTVVAGYIRAVLFPKGEGGRPDPAVVEPALAAMPRLLATLENGYAASAWLAGPALSLADLFFAPALDYLARLPDGPRLLEPAPHVRRALAAVRERPSFAILASA